MRKIAFLILLASALSACGGDDDNNGSSSSSGGSSSSGSGSSSSSGGGNHGDVANGTYYGTLTSGRATTAKSITFFGLVEANGRARFIENSGTALAPAYLL